MRCYCHDCACAFQSAHSLCFLVCSVSNICYLSAEFNVGSCLASLSFFLPPSLYLPSGVSFDLRLRGPRCTWFGTAPAFSHRRGRDVPKGSGFINTNSLEWPHNLVAPRAGGTDDVPIRPSPGPERGCAHATFEMSQTFLAGAWARTH